MEPMHAEYRFSSPGADTAVLFIHGISGTPRRFDFLIERLNGAYSIKSLLLPGHGRTTREFAGSNMDEWQDYVDASVIQLQNAYQNLILVGHSMGCLLAVQAAASSPERMRGLFLISMPLALRPRFSYLKTGFLAAFGPERAGAAVEAARKGNSVTAETPLGYLACVPRYLELFAKIRSTRERIGTLTLPVTALFAAEDEIVGMKSLRYLERLGNVETVIVRKAGHYAYPQEAREQISGALLEFLAGLKTEKSQRQER